MTTHVAASSDPSVANIVSLGCILRLQSVEYYRTISQAQAQEESHIPSWIDSDLQSPGSPASKDSSSKRMSFQRLRSSKKSGTVLHAVPETTACESALLSQERYLSTSTPQAKSCKSASSSPALSSISENEASQGWIQHNTSTTKHDNTLKTASSIASLRGAIGTYKHGRIQWRLKDKHGLSAVKSLKPKIHVVIPSGAQDRTQPTLPASAHPSNAQVRSASAEIENALDISPPSGTTKVMMRDSIVSPLLHQQAVPFGQFQLSTPIASSNPKTSNHCKNNSTSTTSSVDSRESDEFTLHSNHSSETSVEEDSLRIGAKAMTGCPEVDADYGPPPSIPPRRYAPCTARSDNNLQRTCSLRPARCTTNGISRRPTIKRKTSGSSDNRTSIDSHPDVSTANQALSRSASRKSSHERNLSLSLSEAENELERSLTSLTEDTFLDRPTDDDKQPSTSHKESGPYKWAREMRQSAEPAPLLPRKSSKRQSLINAELFRLSRVPNDHIASQITRGRSLRRVREMIIDVPPASDVSTEEFVLSPLQFSVQRSPRIISPSDAENVLYKILQSLDRFEDLFATATVNAGFYRVFKRHELDLVKSVLLKTSPPAWEFREIAFPGHDLLHDEDLEMTRPFEEYTPSSYIHLQNRDTNTMREIKLLIKEKCQWVVRPEISAALVNESSPNAARVDDALWRIWTFCKIFGSGKGRENDIVAQQDWLNGGVQVHQQTCTFSVVSTDFMNDTLISAPDCFAKGNEGGLTAEQLFDMMELWNCLGVLLQGFQSRTAEARKFGIYDDTDIRGGDIDGEEMMLDEWCHHLLSFGLSTILDLARPCFENNGSKFQLAHEKGCTNWKPPVHGSSRRSFLKEAASRVYEDKLAHLYAASSTRELQRQQSKLRIQQYVLDLKYRKTNGEALRTIRQSQDRPMSEWENVMSSLTRQPPPLPTTNNLTSHIPSFRPTSVIAQELSTSIAELPASLPAELAALSPLRTQSPPRRTVAMPLLPSPPPSTVPSVRNRDSIATTMPSIEEHPAYRRNPTPEVPYPSHPAFRTQRTHARKDTDISVSSHGSSESSPVLVHHPVFQQHPAQAGIFDSPAHENTAGKAIHRIVEMGFTADEARDALRMTDLGDGLRVDRAVELLLSRQ